MKKKLIYIVGYPRSGSTILQSILNELPESAAVGEIKTIINYNIFNKKPCSCGETVDRCNHWKSIISKIFDKYTIAELKELNSVRKSISNKYFWKLRLRNHDQLITKNKLYGDFLKNLYAWIFETSDIIIDSSKDPMYGWFIGQILEVEIYYIHLIRDPRACFYSYKKDNKDSNLLRWSWMNWNSGYLQNDNNYLKVGYEDFVKDPERHVDEILQLCNISTDVNPMEKNIVKLNGSHTLAGNPNRFNKGNTQIKASDSWNNVLTKFEKFKVQLFSQPFFSKYGYK